MMESNKATLSILLIVLILLAAFAVILYAYPLKPIGVSAPSNNSNAIKLSDFLSSHDINLSGLQDKDLYYFYGGLPNNSIVFGCDYELYPSLPTTPITSGATQSEYQQIVNDMALSSMCSVENKTNCTLADTQLSSFIEKSMNSTQIEELFNLTYADITGYYDELNYSGLINIAQAEPIRYDMGLFSSARNASSMVNAIIKMKQMTVGIVFNGSGQTLDYANQTAVYSPFQFQVYRLINATGCSTSTIFNLVTDPSSFATKTYTDLYKNLGNYTNICIITNSNDCNSTEMKNLNMTFYAN